MSTPAPAENALIKTSYGDMTVSFWPDVAPRTVDNFLKLSREKFYNGTAIVYDGPIPPGLDGYPKDVTAPTSYRGPDLEEAKRLLK